MNSNRTKDHTSFDVFDACELTEAELHCVSGGTSTAGIAALMAVCAQKQQQSQD
jgi:hypothetical protein